MEATAASAVLSTHARSQELPEPSALTGVKVMVIDDSNTIRRSAEIFLLQAGCTVILADDGFDALAKITDHQPDLIFVDIMMPRLDGYQTCALIKKNAKFHQTPVVMLSSKDGLFDRARGRMSGMGVRHRHIQVGLRRAHLVLQRLHHSLLRRHAGFALHPVLVGSHSFFRQLDQAAAVALRALQGRLRLQQLGLHRSEPRLGAGHAA